MFFRIMKKIQHCQINTIPTAMTYSFKTLFNITFISIPTGLLHFARELQMQFLFQTCELILLFIPAFSIQLT